MVAVKHLEIKIHIDGAIPHTGKGNLDKLRNAGHQTGGWNIVFDVQPSNSPDKNKLDLCFFYSLQQAANKIKGTSKSLTDMVAAVTSACRDYSVDQLRRVLFIAKF